MDLRHKNIRNEKMMNYKKLASAIINQAIADAMNANISGKLHKSAREFLTVPNPQLDYCLDCVDYDADIFIAKMKQLPYPNDWEYRKANFIKRLHIENNKLVRRITAKKKHDIAALKQRIADNKAMVRYLSRELVRARQERWSIMRGIKR